MSLLLNIDDYKSFAGLSGTDAARDASLSRILAGVDAEIRKVCSPVLFTQVAVAGKAGVMAAPPDRILTPEFRPVIAAGFALYLNPDANGDPAAFTSDHLQTLYTDYDIETDDAAGTYSLAGTIRRIGGLWGGREERPAQSLAGRLVATPGAIKLVYTAGFPAVPDDVKEAAALMTAMLYARRQAGMPESSSSWNGGSVSYAGPFTATAALRSPDVWDKLRKYAPPAYFAGGNS